MSTTINSLADYKDVEILGLEPKDRAPNDYLRLTSRVFNSFKPIDPTISISSYINGFETVMSKTNFHSEEVIECYINKGSCFVDDQFIAFKDDIIYRIPVSKIVQNVDYYLVVHYQYTNDCNLFNPAEFQFVAASTYDTSKMLKLVEFKIEGNDLIVKPQKLDDLFMDNYSRLFKIVSDKARSLFKLNSFQGINVPGEKLYKNVENPEWSTKSGDFVFLDIDGLYKPARGCNRKIDKSIGLYIFNPKNGAHTIVTNGIINLKEDYVLDNSNKLLINMEPGKSYYLLDDCSETNYAWEDKQDSRAGKVSSRFTPGNVRVGFAISNYEMMVDVDFSTEMDTANFLELFGLPQQFQDRFNVIYSYWMNLKETDFRNFFIDELNSIRENLSTQKDNTLASINDKQSEVTSKENIFNTTTLNSTRTANPIAVGSVAGPISNTKLKDAITQGNMLSSQYQGESELKYAKIEFLKNYLPKFKTRLSNSITNLITYKTYLTGIKNDISTITPNNVYFQDPYKIQSFTDTFQDVLGFLSLPLPKLKSFGNSTTGNVSLYNASTDSNSNKTYQISNLIENNAVGSHAAGTISGAITSYLETNEIIGLDDHLGSFKNDLTVTLSIVTNLITQYEKVRDQIDNILTSVTNLDITAITNYLDKTGSHGTSVYILQDNVKQYLFDNNLANVLGQTLGFAEYLNNISYFIKNDGTPLSFNTFKNNSEQDFYSNYYIFNYLIQELENVNNYLTTTTGTASDNNQALSKTNDTLKVYDLERSQYLSIKYENFKSLQVSIKDLSNLLINIAELGIEIDEINARLDSENNKIHELETDLNSLDDQIMTRVEDQKSVNSIMYISEYERKIYNYTYLTIRIRLKQKLRKSIQNDVEIVSSVLLNLKSQTIPDRNLIEQTQLNLNSFNSVLSNLNNELTGMVIEYNKLRDSFGINDPVTIDQTDFNDYGLSDPDLECFKNLSTFK